MFHANGQSVAAKARAANALVSEETTNSPVYPITITISRVSVSGMLDCRLLFCESGLTFAYPFMLGSGDVVGPTFHRDTKQS